jgi:hypothetical protein
MAGAFKQLSPIGVIRGVTGVGLGLSGAWNHSPGCMLHDANNRKKGVVGQSEKRGPLQKQAAEHVGE